ncbi:MAG: pyridoxal-phosphate dependent enzyme [Nitrososphaerota archaeon]|jgi:cysteine synthase/rhodanese-related sulfurtransferase|nr:pyridoxal-phosphate dependent enzyme [Nitrososphaerota archaeon]MDG6903276.1 pyridoxal-phosphate dependent enzyme [Nitrososphaerota archaeon]MDG6911863.1 pyridoxal-phosphate dependent enzyme [Nitrososphaerota archaeon]MDG6940656.1 pyridoxal-phosphate dependent enzyme [Nitrososphaerota archaeon]MDG6960966.1 pyridoxal-phosphate dependent enzyme [Nitrososphaerota archaeon]
MPSPAVDIDLLNRFDSEVMSGVPQLKEGTVGNPTPLVEVTDDFVSCADSEYGVKLDAKGVRVFAKMDSKLDGGSVKVRPAVAILHDAIASGRLTKGQTVFEATSGNFGLALSALRRLGLEVIVLVSRRLQQGVVDGLRASGARLVNLDIDICPTPGLGGDANLAVAKGVASSVRQQLAELGLDPAAFEGVRGEAETLLTRQDAIGLAKLLARAYGGFCTEQYENDLNVEVHRTVTGPEVDMQLRDKGVSLGEADFVCAFGTGGTATGVSRYVRSKYGRKGVRVIFPISGQDVAGIRTREKALGLKFYEPNSYAGEHEVDFEEASKFFEFMNRKGYDVGESGALALYATMQLANFGVGTNFVVMVADGSSKYLSEVSAVAKRGRRDQVRLDEAVSSIKEYGGVVWVHNTFIPRGEGRSVIASALGVEEKSIKVADAKDVQAVLNGADPSEAFEGLLQNGDRPLLLVCIGGSTSMMIAKVLERKGVAAESLVGGISGLPGSKGKQMFDLVQIAAN